MHEFTPVYLLRKGNPPPWARAFFASFFDNDPGKDIPLIVLCKGYESTKSPPEVNALLPTQINRIQLQFVSDDGVDLTAYQKLCERSPKSNFLFLNSHSRLQKPDWYVLFSLGLKKVGKKGVVGASGSWETPDPKNIKFPNPHIRTNAFLIHARTYLDLSKNKVGTRNECLAFEAGKTNLTNQVLQNGGAALIINGNGQLFSPEDWPKSQTFRLMDQEQLLVFDNRSAKYHHGTKKRRWHHATASWGERAAPSSLMLQTFLSRVIWAKVLNYGYKFPLLSRITNWK